MLNKYIFIKYFYQRNNCEINLIKFEFYNFYKIL